MPSSGLTSTSTLASKACWQDVRAVKVGNRWNVGWLRGAIALKDQPNPLAGLNDGHDWVSVAQMRPQPL